MPELPEVETVRRSLEKLYLNKKIESITILYPKMIKTNINEFKELVINSTFISFSRIGKYLILNLDNGYSIISHLRMEGKYYLRDKEEDISKYTRIYFKLDNSKFMCYEDTRCFGIMALTKTSEVKSFKEISKLGEEPFTMSKEKLYSILKKKNLEIKACLLDQSIMTGLGNIYVDEVLFKSKINPYRKANTLSLNEVSSILDNSIETLNHAISLGGSTVSSYHPSIGVDGRFQNELFAYGRNHKPCLVCNTIMRKDRLGGRGTTYCPTCQNVSLSIGITGKIASGKSSVLEEFRLRGYPTISCDQIVNNLYKEDKVKLWMIEHFSEAVLNDNKAISKEYIKQVINLDESKKELLESYIHSLVKEKVISFIQKHKESKLVIVEVPLMFGKSHFNTLFDYIIGVTCSSASQIEHLRLRGSKNINNDLLLGQSNEFDKNVGKCDFLITSDGPTKELIPQIDKIENVLIK